jgi:hypothetical protein
LLISINFFVDEAARRVVNVQVDPDSDSMAFHMKLIAEHLPAAFDISRTSSSSTTAPSSPSWPRRYA